MATSSSPAALVPLAPTLALVAIVLTVFGAANSGVDVAINTQGAHVERRYERPILSGLHAMFSLGALSQPPVWALLPPPPASRPTSTSRLMPGRCQLSGSVRSGG